MFRMNRRHEEPADRRRYSSFSSGSHIHSFILVLVSLFSKRSTQIFTVKQVARPRDGPPKVACVAGDVRGVISGYDPVLCVCGGQIAITYHYLLRRTRSRAVNDVVM